MRRRKLVITVAAAALFGVLVVPASAELHRVAVTLSRARRSRSPSTSRPARPSSRSRSRACPRPSSRSSTSARSRPRRPPPPPRPRRRAAPTGPPSQTATPAPTEPPGDEGDGAPARGNQGGDKSGGKQERDAASRTSRDPNAEALTGKLEEHGRDRSSKQVDASNPTRNTDGSPTLDNPTVSLAEPGPARIGVPNFFIEKFRIPPFLLPIYQAAGIEYGVRWEVLAAINEIETDYGRNLNVSSAGALGWMQFMPSTWEAYGVDGNQDGLKDPYNPVDAIFAAARYLRAAGADTDLRARDLRLQPRRLVRRLGHPARALHRRPARRPRRLALRPDAGPLPRPGQGDLREGGPAQGPQGRRRGQNPAYVVESSSNRKGIKIFAKPGAPVVAVNDGRIVRTGPQPPARQLRDAAGRLRQHVHVRAPQVGRAQPTRRPSRSASTRRTSSASCSCRRATPRRSARPRGPPRPRRRRAGPPRHARARRRRRRTPRRRDRAPSKERLFANPDRPNAAAAGGEAQAYELSEGFGAYLNRVFGLDRADVVMKPLKRGARVTAGTVLGRVGRISERNAPHLLFEIRPAGRGAPRIDPKPILDGWKLLESTAIYRAAGRNPFVGKDAQTPSIGQILLMSKEALAQRVLADPNIQVYGCGRRTSAAARSTAACWRRSSSSSPRASSRPSPRCAAATPT